MALLVERYATIAQIRLEGLPGDATTDVKDDQVKVLLERANQLVEQLTNNNIFYASQGTFIFDGTNSYLLQLPLAIIEITELYINNETSPLETTRYRVFNGNAAPQDDRRNPKIELRNSAQPSIYIGTTNARFLKGYDQRIVGTFGFLEQETDPAVFPTGVPRPVNEAVIAIVMLTWRTMYERFGFDPSGGGPTVLGPMKMEKTDDHQLEWWQSDTAFTEIGLVVPQYVHGRLKLYRAPQVMRVAAYRFEAA